MPLAGHINSRQANFTVILAREAGIPIPLSRRHRSHSIRSAPPQAVRSFTDRPGALFYSVCHATAGTVIPGIGAARSYRVKAWQDPSSRSIPLPRFSPTASTSARHTAFLRRFPPAASAEAFYR